MKLGAFGNKNATSPRRVLIGTTIGSRDDALAIARAQIERYFEAPERAWLYVKEEKGLGFHYEIQEGGSGQPYLPSIVRAVTPATAALVLKISDQYAIEIHLRPNGTLQCMILPQTKVASVTTSTALQRATARMRPYSTTGREWVTAGAAAVVLGAVMLVGAGVVHKSFSLVMNGYYEIADSLPSTRLLQLQGAGTTPFEGLASVESLPISQWDRLASHRLQPGELVSQLRYQQGKWDVIVKQVEAAPIATTEQAPQLSLSSGLADNAPAVASRTSSPGVEHEKMRVRGVQ